MDLESKDTARATDRISGDISKPCQLYGLRDSVDPVRRSSIARRNKMIPRFLGEAELLNELQNHRLREEYFLVL
jgi:hypothetical protein